MISRRKFIHTLMVSPALLPIVDLHHGDSTPGFSSRLEAASSNVGNHSADEVAYWKNVRDQFLIPREEAFFNTATLGSMPRPVLEAVTTNMAELNATVTHWDYRREHPDWFSGYRNFPPLMEKIARLIHCDPDEVCTTQNATFGMNFLAQGIDLKEGEEIVQTDQEHPGGSCGWLVRAKRHGAVWKTVPIPRPPNDPDEITRRFASAINSKTRVLAIPHMTSMLGLILPVKRLAALAREQGAKNIFVAIDGAQAVGHIHVDVREIDCDAYYSSPHKWLLAPSGSGLLYVRKSRQSEIWTTLASAEWASYDKGAYRFMQYGTGNLSLLKGYEAALDFHNSLGHERVISRIKHLGDYLRSEIQKLSGATILSSIHPEMSAGITTWKMDGVTGPEMMDRFWNARKIRVRSMGNDNGVRQSTHIYNNEAEIDATLALARDLTRQAS
ncbi:MAG: aminotransferase class V-fold PLP-dependent enzyme [Acidobacteriia bacterium]|nr:aminotransferase class V-fold PLP-dependent enzyme [Terriglobia bacterium]